jgi:hypothetical protein
MPINIIHKLETQQRNTEPVMVANQVVSTYEC